MDLSYDETLIAAVNTATTTSFKVFYTANATLKTVVTTGQAG